MKAKLIKTASGMEVRIRQGEEPKLKDFRTDRLSNDTRAYKKASIQYLSSYKSYPVRSEDEEGFENLAMAEWFTLPNQKDIHPPVANELFNEALSQGIEIDNERVGFKVEDCFSLDKLCKNQCAAVCANIITYATLLTEDKEGEGQGDAVEFAEWIQKEVEKENIMRSVIVGKYLIFENDDVIIRKTTQELYEQFKITRL